MENTKYEIGIVKIKEESYNFKNLDPKLIEDFDSNNLLIGLKFKFDLGEIDDRFIISMNIKYTYKIHNAEIEILNVICSFEFRISNFKSIYKELSPGELDIPDHLIEPLVGICISSMRGVIAVKTAGSFLADYPLPIFDATDIFKKIPRKPKKSTAIKKSVTRKIK